MNPTEHPLAQQLADYASGKLPETDAGAVADHLSQCTECEATFQSLEARSDTLVSGLHAAPTPEPYMNEADCRRAVAGAAKMPEHLPVPGASGTTPPAPAEKSVSTQGPPKLGPYQLISKLGEGGMGAVFKARHEHLGKIVAVKVLPRKAMQDPAAVARFRREMKAVGGLHHPNIVGAHDAGEAQGVHFLVMEYVEGSDLSSLIKKNGPVTVEQAVSYTLQAAKGLAFAHGKNIIHRDIKPANLLVDGEGTVKILDMGLARLDDGGVADREAVDGLTQTGQVMGTVDYMAPEQAFDTHRADAKADVYSLGCTLYRILTGQNAYAGDTVVQKILAHREHGIPPLAERRPEVPAGLDAIYRRMMAKLPEQRPTMAEVARELEALQKPAEAETRRSAEPATVPGPRLTASPPRRRRPPAKLIAAGFGAAALVLLGVVLIINNRRIELPDGSTAKVEVDPSGATNVRVTLPATSPIGSSPLTSASTVPSPLSVPPAPPGKITTHLQPAFQQWVKATQALPAQQQLEEVRKKLMELNPGFDGKLDDSFTGGRPRIESGAVVNLALSTDNVIDLSPLRALGGLTVLHCDGSGPDHGKLSDLSPLQGLRLSDLSFSFTKVSDLSPLAGMPMTVLACAGTNVSDLSPLGGMRLTYLSVQKTLVDNLSALRGMPLTKLHCASAKISDLTPLSGMPLKFLDCTGNMLIDDLSPLRGMPLQSLYLSGTGAADLAPLELCKDLAALKLVDTPAPPARVAAVQRVLPNCKIEWNDPAKKPAAKPLAYLDPAFDEWVTATRALPAAEQLDAVRKKLMDLNSGFDGKLTGIEQRPLPKIENGVVTELGFDSIEMKDISPVRALAGLRGLACAGGSRKTKLSDLSPLRGMQLSYLAVAGTEVSDLTPLAGMPLTNLLCAATPVDSLAPLAGAKLKRLLSNDTKIPDLTPLAGMPLEELSCGRTLVSNLRPLAGMPLHTLWVDRSHVADLSPLESCKKLKSLRVPADKIGDAEVAAMQKLLPDCKIERVDGAAPGSFPAVVERPLAYLDPAFQQWVLDVRKLSAEEQFAAVTKKLVELNPGFDGQLTGYRGPAGPGTGAPKIDKGVVTEVGMICDQVVDLSPLRGFPGLQSLRCVGGPAIHGKLSDLAPLTGMSLLYLEVDKNPELSDLSPLRGMKLTSFSANYTAITQASLAELQGMPLTYLHTGNANVTDLSVLKGMPLEIIYISGSFSDLSPLAGMPLRSLSTQRSQVTNLTPLKGLPLSRLGLRKAPLSDLSPLSGCKDLELLGVEETKVSAEQVAALQKALPKCKITWGLAKKVWESPEFEQWVKDTQALPAERQLEAVSMKLMDLNPGFDGKLTDRSGTGMPRVEQGVVTEVGFLVDSVTDISPLKALSGLHSFACKGSAVGKGKLTDLSPLTGMKLTSFSCSYTPVSDLRPLQGAPLTDFYMIYTKVLDLSPLVGMPLTHFVCGSAPFADISPLKGMQLEKISLNGSQVTDLSPLRGMPLTSFSCSLSKLADLSPLSDCPSLTSVNVGASKVTAEEVAALEKALPNCKITSDDPAKSPSPKKLAYLDPAFQTWVDQTRGLSADKQIEAVSKKLAELNPGFDGKLTNADGGQPPAIDNGRVLELRFVTDQVADISPVRALTGLTTLVCSGSGATMYNGILEDLSPLQGLPLTSLECNDTKVKSLAPLSGMKLVRLSCFHTSVSDLAPLQGMPLTYLSFHGSRQVSDLSPLRGMPLQLLQATHTVVSDPSPLADCRSLKTVHLMSTKVKADAVAALQKTLPNCKIYSERADGGGKP